MQEPDWFPENSPIRIWMSFPEIGLVHDPKMVISQKNWVSFQEIGLSHHPENWNFQKISGFVLVPERNFSKNNQKKFKSQTWELNSFSYSATFSTNDNPSFIDFSSSEISASFAAISSFTLLKISLIKFLDSWIIGQKIRTKIWGQNLRTKFSDKISYGWWKFSSRYSHTKSLSFNSSIFSHQFFFLIFPFGQFSESSPRNRF